MGKMTKLATVRKLNVTGCCANKECQNEITREDEYLIDGYNLYCDSICYTKYMISECVVKVH